MSRSSSHIFSRRQYDWARRRDAASRSPLRRPLLALYRFSSFRQLCLRLCDRLEGGRFFSATRREILERHHGVRVGRYSYGPCLVPGRLPRGTAIGSYCSVAAGLSVYRRGHPTTTLTQHPFFYRADLGLVDRDAIEAVADNPLSIGSDVWIGAGVTILPGCRAIGDGAVIGAGSIVTRDVPPFTIVAGNPARPVKRRYTDDVIAELNRLKWWELSLSDLLAAEDLLVSEVTVDRLRAFMPGQSAIRRSLSHNGQKRREST